MRKTAVLALALILLTACTPHEIIEPPPPTIAEPTTATTEATEPPPPPEPVFEPEPFPYADELYSRAVYVIDADTGAVGLAINETERMMAASTIKIMTALIVLENLDEAGLNQTIDVPLVIFDGFNTDDPNTVGSTLSALAVNQTTLTYRDALYGLMLPSGNDAANAIAWNMGGGDFLAFADMMNAKAAELGCVNTSFVNAHGLHEEGNWSCAYDLALISRYAWDKYPLFREIVGAYEYVMPPNSWYRRGYRIRNGNALMREHEDNIYYREFVRGIKNGGLDDVWLPPETEGGEWLWRNGIANLVSIGTVDGKSYIIVTLEAPYKRGGLLRGQNRLHYAHADHLRLYDEWLFR
jgi:D-alanyl-D-alanine carboxypeptidase (penicillin-binding protein 5/6)